ncbi:MAG: UvrD-helicase domain-containing protein, partial [Deltaproteobacteria bacterium]|nr:UvrD-helicase domain-containing protein [Deltaproteobacteria bacterium]
MGSLSKIDELLSELIRRWGLPDVWEIHEDYYLNELAPNIVKQPGYGEERELELHLDIKNELTDAEWLDLPALIQEKRDGCLRETEKERLDREAAAKAEEEKKRRLAEEEKVRLEKAVIEAERKLLFQALKEKMEEDYLGADAFFTSRCRPLILAEEYEKEKISFIRNWAEVHSGTKVDSEQALAIGAVDRHAQVVARAGSGKTTTIAVRATFMIKHCGIKPNEMLLLAFNRKAAEEMADRLSGILNGTLPHVMTFHALAYAIVHPEESLLYDEPEGAQAKSRALQTVIDDHMRHPDYRERIRNVMMSHFRSDWDRIVAGGFERSKEEFLRYRRSLPRETLQGQFVKSFGEKIIADFLFEHAVPYKYERNFMWSGINYRPDFTIFKSSNSGIVIEYFGLSGDPDYDEMAREKKDFWREKAGWTLLSFTPQDIRKNGVKAFRKTLKNSLEKLGFECERLSEDEIWQRVRDRAIDRFTRAVASFVQRCRKLSLRGRQLTDLVRNYVTTSDVEAGFLDVALPLYEAYLNRIAATGEDDFDGLMQRASEAVSGGHTQFKRLSGSGDLREIRHICIDEYQDFSELFHLLVEAIQKQNPSVLFFCVGDDWQAINRFAGSDLSFYENFQKQFVPSGRFHLSTNYRSCTGIVEIGNALMDGLGKPARAAKREPGDVLFAD